MNTDELRELEQILDSHAESYARATMNYMTNKLDEDSRDKEFHHSDLKTKKAIQKLTQRIALEARIETIKELSLVESTKLRTYMVNAKFQTEAQLQELDKQ